MNEKEILENCANGGIDYLIDEDKETLNIIVKSWEKMELFERPDIIIPLQNGKLLAIEHFEFDASYCDEKGSEDKREQTHRDHKFQQLINNSNISKELVISTSSVDVKYSLENYINNFQKHFQKHLNKIESYKQNLVKEKKISNDKDIIVGFFAVDTTPLGCYYINNKGQMNTLSVCQVLECLNLISSEEKTINYLFLGSYNGKKDSLTFIGNSNIKLNINPIDFSKNDFFCFNPQVTQFCGSTPNDR